MGYVYEFRLSPVYAVLLCGCVCCVSYGYVIWGELIGGGAK
jgi:hypothetical protein